MPLLSESSQACAGDGISPNIPASAPEYSRAGIIDALESPDAAKGGLYVSQFNSPDILAYRSNNKKKKPPTCNIPGVQYLNGVAVDGKGNVIDPDGGSRTIIIFKGPGMCGANAAFNQRPVRAADRCRQQRRAQGQNRRRQHDGQRQQARQRLGCTMKTGCKTNLTEIRAFSKWSASRWTPKATAGRRPITRSSSRLWSISRSAREPA